MPGLVAPLFGFALGIVFAWAARAELARRPRLLESRALGVTALYSILVLTPSYAYFLAFAWDWSFGYFLEPLGGNTPAGSPLERTLGFGLLLLTLVSPGAGFALNAPLAAQQHGEKLARRLALLGLLLGAGLLPGLRRLLVDASYAQYHGNFGRQSLLGSATGYAIVWMGAIQVLAIAWTLRTLTRMGKSSH